MTILGYPGIPHSETNPNQKRKRYGWDAEIETCYGWLEWLSEFRGTFFFQSS